MNFKKYFGYKSECKGVGILSKDNNNNNNKTGLNKRYIRYKLREKII